MHFWSFEKGHMSWARHCVLAARDAVLQMEVLGA